MLKKMSTRWLIIFCLLCTALLLPASAYGQEGQILRITIDQIYSVDKDPSDYIQIGDFRVGENINEFRLVILVTSPVSDQGLHQVSPSADKPPFHITPDGWRPPPEPMVYELDVSSMDQFTFRYLALDQNDGATTFEDPIPTPAYQLYSAVVYSPFTVAKYGWRIVQVAGVINNLKSIYERLTEPAVYGENQFTLYRVQGWNVGHHESFFDGLGIKYHVELVVAPSEGSDGENGGSSVPPTTCSSDPEAISTLTPLHLRPTNRYLVSETNVSPAFALPDNFSVSLRLTDSWYTRWRYLSVNVRKETWTRLNQYPLQICLHANGTVYYKEDQTTGPTPVDPGNHPPNPANVSIQQAIRDYYSLIQRGDYTTAWGMSAAYNLNKGLDLSAFENGWRQSGPAQIVHFADVVENNDTAMAMFRLYYPNSNTAHGFRFEFKRDLVRGHERFGHWVFVRGTQLY